MRTTLNFILLFLLCSLTAWASGPFHGTWNSRFGQLKLVQQGNRVFGDYRNLGPMEGVYNPATKEVTGTFRNNARLGNFKFKMTADGKFTGKWAWGSANPADDWWGNRVNKTPGRLSFKPNFWFGKWKTRFGTLTLTQKGEKVFGKYANLGQIIDAKHDPKTNTLKGKFTNKGKNGNFEFKMASNLLSFTGKWAWGSGVPKDSWNGERSLDARWGDIIDTAMKDVIEVNNLSGIVAGIVKDGQIKYSQGYGYWITDRRIKLTSKTSLRWASISKVITAVAVHQMIEANKIKLSDKVTKHVRYWPVSNIPLSGVIVADKNKKRNITIEHLISHRSGLQSNKYSNLVPYSKDSDGFDAGRAVARFHMYKLLNDPGNRFNYSTSAYTLLGAVIEEKSNGYVPWVRDHILNPLGMSSLAISTSKKYDHKLPGGGWKSNIEDLTKFAAGLINEKLLNRTSRLWDGTYSSNGGYKRGVVQGGSGTNLFVEHGGTQSDVRSLMRIYPNRKDGFAFIIPQLSSDNVRRQIATRINDILQDPNSKW